MSNAGTITTLTNSGAISGGNGGAGTLRGAGGAGGAGVSNAGTIASLTNSGRPARSAAETAPASGSDGDAI